MKLFIVIYKDVLAGYKRCNKKEILTFGMIHDSEILKLKI